MRLWPRLSLEVIRFTGRLLRSYKYNHPLNGCQRSQCLGCSRLAKSLLQKLSNLWCRRWDFLNDQYIKISRSLTSCWTRRGPACLPRQPFTTRKSTWVSQKKMPEKSTNIFRIKVKDESIYRYLLTQETAGESSSFSLKGKFCGESHFAFWALAKYSWALFLLPFSHCASHYYCSVCLLCRRKKKVFLPENVVLFFWCTGKGVSWQKKKLCECNPPPLPLSFFGSEFNIWGSESISFVGPFPPFSAKAWKNSGSGIECRGRRGNIYGLEVGCGRKGEEFKKVRIYFFSFSKEESGKADWTHTYFPREEKRKKCITVLYRTRKKGEKVQQFLTPPFCPKRVQFWPHIYLRKHSFLGHMIKGHMRERIFYLR